MTTEASPNGGGRLSITTTFTMFCVAGAVLTTANVSLGVLLTNICTALTAFSAVYWFVSLVTWNRASETSRVLIFLKRKSKSQSMAVKATALYILFWTRVFDVLWYLVTFPFRSSKKKTSQRPVVQIAKNDISSAQSVVETREFVASPSVKSPVSSPRKKHLFGPEKSTLLVKKEGDKKARAFFREDPIQPDEGRDEPASSQTNREMADEREGGPATKNSGSYNLEAMAVNHEVQTLNAKLQAEQQKVATLMESQNELTKRMDDLQKTNHRLESEQATIQEHYDTSKLLEAETKKRELLERAQQDLHNLLETDKQSKDAIAGQDLSSISRGSLERKMIQIQHHVNDLGKTLSSTQVQLVKSTKTLETEQERAAVLESELSQMNQIVDLSKQEVQMLRANKKDLSHRLSKQKHELKQNRQKQKETELLLSVEQRKTQELADLVNQQNMSSSGDEQLRHENATLKERLKQQQEESIKTEVKIDTLEVSLTNARKEIEEQKKENSDTAANLEEQKAKESELLDSQMKLIDLVESLKEVLDEKATKIEILQREKTDMKNRVESLEEEVAEKDASMEQTLTKQPSSNSDTEIRQTESLIISSDSIETELSKNLSGKLSTHDKPAEAQEKTTPDIEEEDEEDIFGDEGDIPMIPRNLKEITEIIDEQPTNSTLRKELADEQAARASLEEKIKELSGSVESLQRDLERKQEHLPESDAQETITQLSSTVESLQKELEGNQSHICESEAHFAEVAQKYSDALASLEQLQVREQELEGSIAQLNTQINCLRGELYQNENIVDEARTLKEVHSSVRKNLDNEREKVKFLETEKSALIGQVEALEKSLGGNQDGSAGNLSAFYAKEQAKTTMEINTLNEKIREQEAVCSLLQTDKEELSRRVSTLHTELVEGMLDGMMKDEDMAVVETELARARENYEQQREIGEEQAAHSELQFDIVMSEKIALEQTLSEREESLAHLRAEKVDLVQRVEVLESELSTSVSSNQKGEADIQDLETELASTKKDLEHQRTLNDEHVVREADQQDQLQTLTSDLADRDRQISEAKLYHGLLEQSRDGFKDSLEQEQASTEALQAKSTKLNEHLQSVQRDLSSTEEKLLALEKDHAATVATLEEHMAKEVELLADAESLTTRYDTLAEELKKTETQLEETRAERDGLEGLRTENAEISNDMNTLLAEKIELKGRVASLQKELEGEREGEQTETKKAQPAQHSRALSSDLLQVEAMPGKIASMVSSLKEDRRQAESAASISKQEVHLLTSEVARAREEGVAMAEKHQLEVRQLYKTIQQEKMGHAVTDGKLRTLVSENGEVCQKLAEAQEGQKVLAAQVESLQENLKATESSLHCETEKLQEFERQYELVQAELKEAKASVKDEVDQPSDEAVAKLESELETLQKQLQEEQDRAKAIEAEKAKLMEESQQSQPSDEAVAKLESELETLQKQLQEEQDRATEIEAEKANLMQESQQSQPSDEAVAKLESDLNGLNKKLQEEQDRAKEIEAEKVKLMEETQQAQTVAKNLELEMDKREVLLAAEREKIEQEQARHKELLAEQSELNDLISSINEKFQREQRNTMSLLEEEKKKSAELEQKGAEYQELLQTEAWEQFTLKQKLEHGRVMSELKINDALSGVQTEAENSRKLQVALDEARSLLEEKEKSLNTLQESMGHSSESSSAMEETIGDLQSSKAALQNEVDSLKQRVAMLEAKCDAAKQELEQSETAMAELQEKSDARLEEEQSRLQELQERLSSLQSDQDEHRRQLDSANQDKSNLESKCIALEEELQSAKSSAGDEQLKELQESLAKAQADHEEQAKELASEQERVQELEEALAAARADREEQVQNLSSMRDEERATAKKTIENLEEQINAIQGELEQSQATVAGLQASSASELKREQARVAELQKSLEAREGDNSNAVQEMESSLRQEQERTKKLELFQGRNKVMMETQRNAIKELEHSNDRLELALAKAQEKMVGLKQNFAKQHEGSSLKLQESQSELTATQKELSECQPLKEEVERLNLAIEKRDRLLKSSLELVQGDMKSANHRGSKEELERFVAGLSGLPEALTDIEESESMDSLNSRPTSLSINTESEEETDKGAAAATPTFGLGLGLGLNLSSSLVPSIVRTPKASGSS